MMLKNGITGLFHGHYIAEHRAFFRVANVSSILGLILLLETLTPAFFFTLAGISSIFHELPYKSNIKNEMLFLQLPLKSKFVH